MRARENATSGYGLTEYVSFVRCSLGPAGIKSFRGPLFLRPHNVCPGVSLHNLKGGAQVVVHKWRMPLVSSDAYHRKLPFDCKHFFKGLREFLCCQLLREKKALSVLMKPGRTTRESTNGALASHQT